MAPPLVLVVEDDAKSRKLVRDVLAAQGCEIIEAAAGDAGVILARQRLPRLIVMDIRLPGLDGITALAQLRADARTRAIPVLAVTASAMPGDSVEIGAAGFDACLRKPIDVHELIAVARQLLERGVGGESAA